jgi:tRNA/tmRNA/rRNA uracil-C5-methylase (TrmA/RlmC/RlmD family)
LRTLVRDLKLLTNYEVISVTPIKMFFQTVEMETLVYLEAKK